MCYPEQIIDYLALVGDSSDNIPGIEKVGPKTAAKWLGQYGTLDNLIAHAQEISGKVGENLRAGLATLELSRKLATIHTDLDMPLSSEQLIPAAPDVEQLRELYTRYELRALLRQLDGGESSAAGATTGGGSGLRVRLQVGERLRLGLRLRRRLPRLRRRLRIRCRSSSAATRPSRHGRISSAGSPRSAMRTCLRSTPRRPVSTT